MKQSDENKVTVKDDLDVIIFILKLINKFSKSFIPIALVASIFKAVVPFVNIIMPKLIIDELMGARRPQMFILLIGTTIFANFILSLINSGFDRFIEAKNDIIQKLFNLEVSKKAVSMDYCHVENPKILDAKERAVQGMMESGGITTIIYSTKDIITKIFTVAGLLYVLFELSSVIIALIVLIVIVNTITEKMRQDKDFIFWADNAENNKLFGYLASQVVYDYNAGKYIRLYNVVPLIMERYRKFDKNSLKLFKNIANTDYRFMSISIILGQIEMIAIYGYLAYRVIIDPVKFTIGSFTMYASATTNFASNIIDILSLIVRLRFACKYIRVYKDFLELPDIMPHNNRHIISRRNHEIEFKNVSFKYPGAEQYAIKNVSLKIPVGKKLAIVGLNGAGKTTFIKLLMRLYDPQEGEILLDGVNIKEYDYKEYLKLFSVVFQDFKLLSFTIKENISLADSETTDDDKILEVLKDAGLSERIKELEYGIETAVSKKFDEKGIEFSGGESQKLAIARALYKDAPIVILDEPTAALDPISEYEIYSKFDALVGDKTSIFISHRLSSCRFCDYIAVFHNGEIIQYGKHEELLKDENSKYAELWNAQAQYYN